MRSVDLQKWYQQDLIRQRVTVEERAARHIIVDAKKCLNFSGNDYLGMSQHPKVVQAFIQGVQEYGLGSGASALVSGFYRAHRELEEKFAQAQGYERSILFSSGYLANLGVLTTLANRNDIILADRQCHASILAGIQLARAKHIRFHHNDVQHAEALLTKHPAAKLLITESVFSMSGEIAPVPQLADLRQRYQNIFIVDDAHGFGVLGANGLGIKEHFNLRLNDMTCVVTPLGKAFGSMGALVSGSHAVIEALIQFASTYRYSTALPPAMATAASMALDILVNESWRRGKLMYLIHYFIQGAKALNLPLLADDLTPIKAILIGENKLALKIKKALQQAGMFVSCIRPPTVAKNTARIRISLTCDHEEQDIDQLLNVMAATYATFKH